MNRLKSALMTVETKESLLPNNRLKATSQRNSKEIMTPDARQAYQNKLKSVLEVDEAEDKSSDGSSDDEGIRNAG